MPPEDDQTGHRLDEIEGVPDPVVQTLAARWIETAEQVLAMSGDEELRSGLATLLDIDTAALQGLLDLLTDAVGSDAANRLREPTPGGETGVILTEEQRRRFQGDDDVTPRPGGG